MSWRAIALLAVLAGVPLPSQAASPQKACLRGCNPLQRACLQQGGANLRAARASCTGSERRACRGTSKRVVKAAKQTCRAARAACRTCCRQQGTGCAVPPEVPIFSGTFPLPDRRALEALPLPLAPDGRSLVLAALPDGIFGFDPSARGPVSAAAECAAVVLACFHPGERNWAGCFAGVPPCDTDAPWTNDGPMCCASGCGARYQALRRAGRTGPAAFAASIWEPPSCMPGVVGHVEPAS